MTMFQVIFWSSRLRVFCSLISHWITRISALWKFVCWHRCSYETTPFKKEHSISYIYILKTFRRRIFVYFSFIINALIIDDLRNISWKSLLNSYDSVSSGYWQVKESKYIKWFYIIGSIVQYAPIRFHHIF